LRLSAFASFASFRARPSLAATAASASPSEPGAETGIARQHDESGIERDGFLRIAIPLYLFLSMIFSENRFPLFRIMLYSAATLLIAA
jgi:hypothetical protein